jgi:hypothetical protein
MQGTRLSRSIFLHSEGKTTEAQELCKAEYLNSDGKHILTSGGLLLALFADELKNEGLRDEALAKVTTSSCTRGDDNERCLVALSPVIQAALKKGPKTSLDETALNEVFKKLEDNQLIGLFAARYEMLHGTHEKAVEYFTKAFNVKGPQYRAIQINRLIAIWGKALKLDLVAMERVRPMPPPKKPNASGKAEDF